MKKENRHEISNWRITTWNLSFLTVSLNGFDLEGGDGFVNDQNKYQHWFFLILPKYSGHSPFVIISNNRD
jgi:hypothetical protein